MITTLLHQGVTYMAAAPAAETSVSTSGVTTWLKNNAVPVLILVVGLGLLMKSNKGDHSAVLMRTGLVVVALAVITIALDSTLSLGIGKFVIGIFGIKA